MRNQLPLTSALIAALLQAGCAQMGIGSKVESFSKPDMPPCQTNLDCRVAVYAGVGAAQECQLYLLFGKVTVAPARFPRVVWRIEKADPGDNFNYRFKFDPDASPPVYGVNIIGNDQARDFNQPNFDGVHWRFQWRSRHLRAKSFDYELNVERQNADGTWSDCILLDPKIVNE